MPEEKLNPTEEQNSKKEYKTTKEKLDEITAGIEEGIKSVFNSENYKDYLTTMSKFHNYSLNNCILIYMQNPYATKVASFKAWSEKFERHVNKGEKGIKIIAPTPYKKKIDVQKIDPNTKQPIKDNEGNPIFEQKEITMPAFKAVTVFDVSQTQGKPLPEIIHSLTGKVTNYEFLKDAIENSAPVPMKFEKLRSGLDGFFSPKEQAITINDSLSEPLTLCAMIHETAHSMLHNPNTSHEKKSRDKEEIEAESVAYSVCKYLGIDTDENSFGYLAVWSKDKDVKELRESLEIINETSSKLINTIEDKYKEILAERNIPETTEIEGKAAEMPEKSEDISVNIIPPSPELTQETLDKFGYIDKDMFPLTKERAEELLDKGCAVYLLFDDNTEAQANDILEIELHYGMLGIEKSEWAKVAPDILDKDKQKEKEQKTLPESKDNFIVYEQKETKDRKPIKKESVLKKLEKFDEELKKSPIEKIKKEPELS